MNSRKNVFIAIAAVVVGILASVALFLHTAGVVALPNFAKDALIVVISVVVGNVTFFAFKQLRRDRFSADA